MLDYGPSISPAAELDLGQHGVSWSEPARPAPGLRIGLLNNMPAPSAPAPNRACC
jgi:homoserine O-succinyltransferase/O-acetyltransferase